MIISSTDNKEALPITHSETINPSVLETHFLQLMSKSLSNQASNTLQTHEPRKNFQQNITNNVLSITATVNNNNFASLLQSQKLGHFISAVIALPNLGQIQIHANEHQLILKADCEKTTKKLMKSKLTIAETLSKIRNTAIQVKVQT